MGTRNKIFNDNFLVVKVPKGSFDVHLDIIREGGFGHIHIIMSDILRLRIDSFRSSQPAFLKGIVFLFQRGNEWFLKAHKVVKERGQIDFDWNIDQLEKDFLPLEDFKYSFKRITNFKNPAEDFELITGISEVEFNALSEDHIFFTRTLLAEIIESLPIQHKKAISNSPLIHQEVKSKPSDILIGLKKYIQENILDQYSYLSKGYTVLKDITNQEKMIFTDNNEKVKLNINTQLTVFTKKDKVISESLVKLIGRNVDLIDKDKYELSFFKLFGGDILINIL